MLAMLAPLVSAIFASSNAGRLGLDVLCSTSGIYAPHTTAGDTVPRSSQTKRSRATRDASSNSNYISRSFSWAVEGPSVRGIDGFGWRFGEWANGRRPPSSDTVPLASPLDCKQLEDEVGSGRMQFEAGAFSRGGVKQMYKGTWTYARADGNGLAVETVVLSRAYTQTTKDFLHGVEMLELFSGQPRVVPLLGVCKSRSEYVTRYYKHGSADNWERLLSDQETLDGRPTMLLRLQAAIDLLQSFVVLHESGNPAGSHIMCDAREGPSKLLSQYLVDDEYRLLLNDLDATPLVRPSTTNLTHTPVPGVPQPPTVAKCGHQQFGALDFVAPEQLWPQPSIPFDDHLMPGYTEKVDIWRLPKTISTLLGALVSSPLLTLLALPPSPLPAAAGQSHRPYAAAAAEEEESATGIRRHAIHMTDVERSTAAAQLQTIAHRCSQSVPYTRPKASDVAAIFSRFVKLMTMGLSRDPPRYGARNPDISDYF